MKYKNKCQFFWLVLLGFSSLFAAAGGHHSHEVADIPRAKSTENSATGVELKIGAESGSSTAKSSTPSASDKNCNDNGFENSGRGLLDAIKNQGFGCVERLFDVAPERVKIRSFSEKNIITVANETRRVAQVYNGTDPGKYLSSLYLWLRSAYYYGNRKLLTEANQAATKSAIEALLTNRNVFNKDEENGFVVENAAVVILNAEVGKHFVQFAIDLLRRFDKSYSDIISWDKAAVAIFWNALDNCSRDKACRSREHTVTLIRELGDFIHDNLDWLDTPQTDHHLHNLGYHLAKIYAGSKDRHFPGIKAELEAQLRKVFDNFGPYKGDKGQRAYLQALTAVQRYKECSTYNICGKKDEIIDRVLDDRITCSSQDMFIWAQDMNREQLEWVCSSLPSYKSHFHTTLETRNIPVTPDDNDKLRMVVFNNKREWSVYGAALFGAGTDNGGLYLEGDPSREGDQATFFAYEEVPARPVFDILNLRHEYIHYLDGRYNTHGGFREVDEAGRTVWYVEGLAEYISRRNCNDEAATEAKKRTYALSTIFKNKYGVGLSRIYTWGYLANRFMFERHRREYFEMLDLFREGKYKEYRAQMVDVWVNEKTYDAEFAAWLPTVKSTGCVEDKTRPASPIEPINVDDVQGDDQAGVDACAAGRPQNSTGAIDVKAGEAACLPSARKGQQSQVGLYVPEGLVNVSLEVTLRYGTGNTTLYHRHDARPNPYTGVYDHIVKRNGTEKTLIVDSVKPGWNYLHILGESDFSGITLLTRYIQNGVDGNTRNNRSSNTRNNRSSNTRNDRSSNTRDNRSSNTRNDRSSNTRDNRSSNTRDNRSSNTRNDGLIDACATQAGVRAATLLRGAAVCVQNASRGDDKKFFKFSIDNNVKRVIINTGHGSGNASLYHKHKGWPTERSFHNTSKNNGNRESIIINNPREGWHYIMVNGNHKGMSIKMNTD